MQFLKVSTGVTVHMGPFLDQTDGVTAELSVALTNTTLNEDVAYAVKSDGTEVILTSGPARTFAAMTELHGWYNLTLLSGDVDTLGPLTVVIQDPDVHLPVFAKFMVVPVQVYESLIDGSDNLDVQVAGTDNIGLSALQTTDINTEIDTALSDIGLDHLVNTTVVGSEADVADGSIIAQLVSKEATADWDDFDNTTDSLQAQSDNVGTAGAGLTTLGGMSATMKGEIEKECNDALVAEGLDHLVQESVAGADITDNSIIAKLVSKEATADWDDFDNTADSLQALQEVGIQTVIGNVGGSVGSVTGSVGSVTTVHADSDLTADITDLALPADGATPSVRQALLMITRFLMERSVSGTTLTVTKEDGSSESMTFTLDDASTPTSITRAT